MNIEVPNTPEPHPETVPVNSTVARSIAKPDAFAKPATMGNKAKPAGQKSVRVRLTNEKARGRPRKHKRDPRNVHYF